MSFVSILRIICMTSVESFADPRTLANMSPKLIVPILETWTQLYTSLQSSPYSYAQIFENKGAAVGCSNPHPHCQVWTTSHIPHEPLQECHSLFQYRQNTIHVCCAIMQSWRSKSRRELFYKKGCGLLSVHIGLFGHLKFCYYRLDMFLHYQILSKQELGI